MLVLINIRLAERLRNALSKSIKTPREFSDIRSEYSELSNGETLLDSVDGEDRRSIDSRCKQITTDSHGRPVKPTKKGKKVVIATLKDGRKRERRYRIMMTMMMMMHAHTRGLCGETSAYQHLTHKLLVCFVFVSLSLSLLFIKKQASK